MLLISPDDIKTHLTYAACIPAMKDAMIQLANGKTEQMLRNILPLGGGNMFGIMAGTLGPGRAFGSKLVGVTPERTDPPVPSHQGVVVVFDPATRAPVCQAEAGTITAIRTACASAMATDLLALSYASILTIMGTGEQAHHHALAIAEVRPLSEVRVWGRDQEKADQLAAEIGRDLGISTSAFTDGQKACQGAHIICTVTASWEPVLFADWVSPGAHINLVGSSYDGPRECDDAVIKIARVIADSTPSVQAQGAELRHAIASGVVGEDHLVGEIGEIASGRLQGRVSPDDITLYNSLGHIVQDIAATALVFERMKEVG
ncbi:MAG: ornithine cyclodeaminase [Ponticaulis sp.]|nr:ornithine cyclodeaminase [Ponticaulis sp.]